jgi:hypothetical protein
MTNDVEDAAIDHHAAAHRATEFVYGTIAVLIVIAGIDISGIDISGSRASAAPAIILVAAIATWFAHAYAATLGLQLTSGRSIRRAEVGRALTGSFPIVLAALPATAASVGALMGFWTSRTSIVLANVLALLVLAAAGWFAARGSGDTRLQSLVSAVVSTSIGLAIVAMELLVHH